MIETRQWLEEPDSALVLSLTLDERPAWLWDAAGENLIWRNAAAVAYRGRNRKRKGPKFAKVPVPIKGQVKRMLRMGAHRRADLTRVRFLAGNKPLSETCTSTPLRFGGDEALLLVANTPLDQDVIGSKLWSKALAVNGFADEPDYCLVAKDDTLIGTPKPTRKRFSRSAIEALVRGDAAEGIAIDQSIKVGPKGARLLFLSATEAVAVSSEGVAPDKQSQEAFAPVDGIDPEHHQDPAEDTKEPADTEEPAEGADMSPDATVDPSSPVRDPAEDAVHDPRTLGELVDRLAGHDPLFEPLDEPGPRKSAPQVKRALFALDAAGEALSGQASADQVSEAMRLAALAGDTISIGDRKGAPIPRFDRHGKPAGLTVYPVTSQPAPAETTDSGLWIVRGRTFSPDAPDGAQSTATASTEEVRGEPSRPSLKESLAEIDRRNAEQSDTEVNAREAASRYNFDELSRILNARIVSDEQSSPRTRREPAPEADPAEAAGDLVPLSDETLVLNRLPLGLMIFRDQSMLFANRAMADLTGYGTSSALRSAGLEGLFRHVGEGRETVGPVTELIGRDGRPVPVMARLQSITWQGQPALLLSARAAGEDGGAATESGSVRTALELIAARTGDGYIRLSRTGIIDAVDPRAEALLGPSAQVLVGRPLLSYLLGRSRTQFAGLLSTTDTTGTLLDADAGAGAVRIALVADRGAGGEIDGYVGLVQPVRPEQASENAAAAGEAHLLAPLLAQLARDLRGPLNTIIGFSDLIANGDSTGSGTDRTAEYARDINLAGSQINTLVDELNDLARFTSGEFDLSETEVDLIELLEACARRIRDGANARQIVVRTAVSQALPAIRADRTLLTQTILNMLASAIALASAGGHVILSAQAETGGGIAVHVRDMGEARKREDPADGFVVYREAGGREWVEEPLRSRVGLAVTQSLARANALTLSLDPLGAAGTLMTLEIPPEKVVRTDR